MEPTEVDSNLVVVSGWRGVGKTAFLQKLINRAKSYSWTVHGLLSPARLKDGQKAGIEVVDLQTGDQRLLASIAPTELKGLPLGPWVFDRNAIIWGNEILKNALPCDLLIVDELGPLEFDQNEGWTSAFQLLDQSEAFRMAVVVIRPEYLERFQMRFSQARVAIVDETVEFDTMVGQFFNQLA